MSMNRYAGSGPIMAAVLAMGPELGTSPGVRGSDYPVNYKRAPAAYPGLSNDELARMIENLADQVSELAAQNVELRQRLTKLETPAVSNPLVDVSAMKPAEYWQALEAEYKALASLPPFAGKLD